MRHSRSEAQHCSAGAATDIENELMRLRRDRGGEEHRIDGDAVSCRRLFQANAAAEQTVLSKTGLFCRQFAHCEFSPAAARTEQARG